MLSTTIILLVLAGFLQSVMILAAMVAGAISVSSDDWSVVLMLSICTLLSASSMYLVYLGATL